MNKQNRGDAVGPGKLPAQHRERAIPQFANPVTKTKVRNPMLHPFIAKREKV